MQDSSSNGMAAVIGLIIVTALIAAVVAFFRGPAKRSEEYVKTLASRIADPNDAALLMSLYQQKGAKNVVLAWLLTVFFSPTIAYLYIGETTKALIAFVTVQGFGVWWVISWFSMPLEVLARNKKAADDALTQLRLMRPQLNVSVTPYQVQSTQSPPPLEPYTPIPQRTSSPALSLGYAPPPQSMPSDTLQNALPLPPPDVPAPAASVVAKATVPPVISLSRGTSSLTECFSCKAALFPDSRFCEHCGSRVSDTGSIGRDRVI